MTEVNPTDREREAYLAEKRRTAMIVHYGHFTLLCQRYLANNIPPLHAAAFRLQDGTEGIIIGYDQFQHGFGQDFTFLIPYEIEHEAQELWLTRGQTAIDPYGPAHYEAIRLTLAKAHQDGNLEALLEMKRIQMKTFQALGDIQAENELEFYNAEANKLKGIR